MPAPRSESSARPPRAGCLRVGARGLALLVVLGLGALGWNGLTRVEVLPGELEAAPPDTERARAWALLSEALGLASGYLESPFNRSMPSGRLEAGPEALWLRTAEGDLPLKIWHSWAGDLAVLSGAVAQECIGGFRVGSRPGDDPQVDHSLLRRSDGSYRRADQVAKTLLHEAAHAVHAVGNFGFFQSLSNYFEIAWNRASWADRSFERAPQGVDHEFFHWLATTDDAPTFRWSREGALTRLTEHLSDPDRTCEHGPAAAWRLAW